MSHKMPTYYKHCLFCKGFDYPWNCDQYHVSKYFNFVLIWGENNSKKVAGKTKL